MSYGHGIAVSLLQLARAYTLFSAEGELKPVSLLRLEAPAAASSDVARHCPRREQDAGNGGAAGRHRAASPD